MNMIKVFRKIRQNMIKEKKVTNYFLYAVGEIVLVVIGILIALQINNTSENQKKRQIELSYLERLVIDLKDNEKLWTDFRELKEKQLKAANIFLKFSFNKNKDSVLDIIMPHFNSVFSWVDLNINQVTYTRLYGI